MTTTLPKTYPIEQFLEDFYICLNQITSINAYQSLREIKYEFSFMTGTRTLGMCRSDVPDKRYTIFLNSDFADACYQDNNREKIRNTIMHEICHSVHNGMCHTGAWKIAADRMNKQFGYTISRTTKVPETFIESLIQHNKYKYKVECENCGTTNLFARETKLISIMRKQANRYCSTNPKDYRCSKCHKTAFILTYL